MDLREGGAVDARRHWYYRAKARPLLEFAAAQGAVSEIVDVGAGSGFFSDILGERLPGARLIQVDAAYESESPRRRRELPARIGPAALVLLMDVLEHVDDDEAFLRSVVARCARPCAVFVTVPALPSLWSRHDEFLGHRRRYTLERLEDLARRAGLSPVRAYYYFGLLLPAAWLKRRLFPARDSELSTQPGWLDAALGAACRLEHPFRARNRAGGLTCVLEARLP